MGTEKEIRFQKIAEARTNRVLKDLSLLANCANKNNYAYTQEQVTLMIRAIDEAVKDLKMAYSKKLQGTKSFSFKK